MTHTTLVLLRHGRTEWNASGRLQGQADVALDDNGLAQAEAAADYFATWHFDACYSSDLKRASVTADAVAARHGLGIGLDPRLQEMNVGTWSGKTTAEVERELPEFVRLYSSGIDFRRSATGETQAEMLERNLAGIRDILDRHPNQSVLVVTHGLVIACLVRELMGVTDPAVVPSIPSNACYSVLGWREGRGWLVTHNAPTSGFGLSLPPKL